MKLVISILSFVGIVLVHSIALGESGYVESPFNHLRLKLNETPEDYSFQVAGHIYGATITQRTRFYPSSSVLCNLEKITGADLDFCISVGDFVPFFHTSRLDLFEKHFLAKVNVPFFNVVGNHEVAIRDYYGQNGGRDRSGYLKKYGEKTYYDFHHGNELFIFLDGELKIGDIQGDQLSYLLRRLDDALMDKTIKNILIFSHKIVWAVNNDEFKVLYDQIKRFGYPEANSFKDIIEPKIRVLSKAKNVYWISSEIGPRWSYDSLFYHKVPNLNLTYIATGLGDRVQDKILQFDVKKNGEIQITPISLSDRAPEKLEYYGLDYWAGLRPEKEEIQQKILRIFKTSHFWYGVLTTCFVFVFLVGIVAFIRKRDSSKHVQ